MSNASNLSTLANVLDDGSDGQFLKSTGSGGVAFDTVAAGAVVYATADLLPLSGNSAGDMAYVTATNRFYINNGSGWYSVSLVNTNPNITSVQDAGSNTTPFTLATDGTATVITVTAADPEEVPLTYDYSVTSGSLNGSTVTKGTGSNSNVFTVTPHASQDATFTLTFTASDGINQATSANAFSLSFVTIVTDSNHTTLLATATGTSDNNNITDSSSNSHSITVNGDTYAGTFSPYRSGGYSTYFDGAGDYITIPASSNLDVSLSDTTIEGWFYTTSTSVKQCLWEFYSDDNNYVRLFFEGGDGNKLWLSSTSSGNERVSARSSATLSINTWYHIAVTRTHSSGAWETYINGSVDSGASGTESASVSTATWPFEIGRDRVATDRYWNGYISDFRVVKGTAITPPSGGPTERLEAVTNTSLLTCHLPYIADGSTNDHSITVNGNTSTKPIGPYDYEEYAATDHGGSVYFDGNGDYLGLSDNSSFDLSGEFAWECWIYRKGNGSGGSGTYQAILGANGSSSDGFTLYITQATGALSIFQSSFIITGSTGDILDNQWSHILLMRDSSNLLQLFINGTRVSSSTNTTSFTDNSSGSGLRIGYDINANAAFNGYISDVRLFKGSTGGYSSGASITVPTAPLSSSGASLHIKGTDASIIDKSQGINLKLVGDTTGSTTQVKFSNTKSMYFDSSGDYIDVSEGFIPLGTSDFTIETWFYPTANPTSHEGIFSNGTHNSGNWLGLLYNSSRKIRYDIAGNTNNLSTTTLSLNNWYHIMLCRFGGNIRLYINGVHEHSRTNSSDLSYETARIGSRIGLSNYELNSAYLQDLRITKGLVRHVDTQNPTTSFTPPSTPLEG